MARRKSNKLLRQRQNQKHRLSLQRERLVVVQEAESIVRELAPKLPLDDAGISLSIIVP